MSNTSLQAEVETNIIRENRTLIVKCNNLLPVVEEISRTGSAPQNRAILRRADVRNFLKYAADQGYEFSERGWQQLRGTTTEKLINFIESIRTNAVDTLRERNVSEVETPVRAIYSAAIYRTSTREVVFETPKHTTKASAEEAEAILRSGLKPGYTTGLVIGS